MDKQGVFVFQENRRIVIKKIRDPKAFTLIELIVVIVIIAISAAISIPRITAGIDTVKFRHAVSEVVSFLRKTHLDSIKERKEIIVTIDFDENTLNRNDDILFYIPKDIVLNVAKIDDEQNVNYTFFNNGRGAGPRIEFLGNNKRKATVYVDLISGLAKYDLN